MSSGSHDTAPNAILGHGSAFEGKLTFEGAVRIDGQFSGEIFSQDLLVIGEGAEVRAEIDVGLLIIHGNTIGNIRARQGVEIHSPGRLHGNIETPSLLIEKGVLFEGSCSMEGLDDDEGPPPQEP